MFLKKPDTNSLFLFFSNQTKKKILFSMHVREDGTQTLNTEIVSSVRPHE